MLRRERDLNEPAFFGAPVAAGTVSVDLPNLLALAVVEDDAVGSPLVVAPENSTTALAAPRSRSLSNTSTLSIAGLSSDRVMVLVGLSAPSGPFLWGGGLPRGSSRLPRAVVKALVEETSAPLGVKGTGVVGEEGSLERGHLARGRRPAVP